MKAQHGLADLRPLFPGEEYIGIDIEKGRGVDQVMDAHKLTFPDHRFGAVLMVDVLEHMAFPFMAIAEAYRVLKDPGWIFISTHMNWEQHYPPDYWRVTPQGMELLMQPFGSQMVFSGHGRSGDRGNPDLVVGIGMKQRIKGQPSVQNRLWFSICDQDESDFYQLHQPTEGLNQYWTKIISGR